MSEDPKKVVAADMNLIDAIRNTSTNRRGGSDDSERNKVKVLLERALDGLTKGMTPELRKVELTQIVTFFRQMAVLADGKTIVNIENGVKTLSKGERWYISNDVPFEDRYRRILTYITPFLKRRKDFVKETEYSTLKGKDLIFVVYKGTPAKAAAKK